MAPIRVPLYKNWSGGFCNYLFQTERVPRNTRRCPRCKSCIFLFKTELAEFAILQTILKTPLSLNCTMALDQSTKGPLLNFSKFYKHKSKSGYAETKSKANYFFCLQKTKHDCPWYSFKRYKKYYIVILQTLNWQSFIHFQKNKIKDYWVFSLPSSLPTASEVLFKNCPSRGLLIFIQCNKLRNKFNNLHKTFRFVGKTTRFYFCEVSANTKLPAIILFPVFWPLRLYFPFNSVFFLWCKTLQQAVFSLFGKTKAWSRLADTEDVSGQKAKAGFNKHLDTSSISKMTSYHLSLFL